MTQQADYKIRIVVYGVGWPILGAISFALGWLTVDVIHGPYWIPASAALLIGWHGQGLLTNIVDYRVKRNEEESPQ